MSIVLFNFFFLVLTAVDARNIREPKPVKQNKVYHTASHLNAAAQVHHQEIQEAGEIKKFKCDLCKYTAARKRNLTLHRRMHIHQGSFECLQCDARFYRKTCLKRHLLSHTGEKPFKCDHCGYASAQKGNLRVHSRTHSGERPFKCDLCSSSFNRPQHLAQHRWKHFKF